MHALRFTSLALCLMSALSFNAQAASIPISDIWSGAKATGEDSTAVGNSAQATNKYAIALGWGAEAKAHSAIAIGKLAESNVGQGSIAIGSTANAAAQDTIAIGVRTEALARTAIALGHSAKANEIGAIAIGSNSEAGKESTVLGASSYATAKKALALGTSNRALADNSASIGYSNQIDNVGTNTFVFGGEIKTSATNAVVLGFKSEGVDNAVSIGSAKAQRKLVNMANGDIAKDSHDAINGSQIHDIVEKAEGINVTNWAAKLGNGEVEDGDTNLVTGEKVYDALVAKADIDANNIHEQDWANALSKGAEVKKGNTMLVTGDMVAKALQNVQPQQVDLSNLAKADASNIDRQAWRDKLGINDLEKNAYRGIAMGFAMNGIQPVPGKNTSVGVGLGNFKGHTAMAVGVRSNLNNPSLNLNLSLGYDMHKNVGVSTGVNIGW